MDEVVVGDFEYGRRYAQETLIPCLKARCASFDQVSCLIARVEEDVRSIPVGEFNRGVVEEVRKFVGTLK
jgi:hypothetical protein